MTAIEAHSIASVSSRHAIHGISEFATTALRDAHVYTSDDLWKIVKVTAGQAFYLITSVAVGVATFRPIFNASSERWNPPAAAHADDEEFLKTWTELQAAGWALYDGTGTTVAVLDDTISPYTDDVTNHHVNGNTYKPSWLTWQIRHNNTRYYLLKPWTPQTNEAIMARLGQKVLAVDDAADIGLVVCAAQAGPKPDPSVRVEIITIDTTGGRKLRAASNGAAPFFDSGGNAIAAALLPYVQLHKLGTTWHVWAGSEGGDDLYGTSVVNAGTMAYVGFVGQCNTGTPGSGFVRADFLRFVNSSTFVL